MDALDSYLNPQGAALSLRNKRMEILGSNIANAGTPNFKARDIDFASAYKAALNQTDIATTTPLHLASLNSGSSDAQTVYRVPVSPSLDGNTVELHVEQVQFAENATHYEASLQFLQDRLHTLQSALKGE
jgi:flagellar basal-body rod protein FlgB